MILIFLKLGPNLVEKGALRYLVLLIWHNIPSEIKTTEGKTTLGETRRAENRIKMFN